MHVCVFLCDFRFALQKIEQIHFHFTFDCKHVDVNCDNHRNEYELKMKNKRRERNRILHWSLIVEVMHEFIIKAYQHRIEILFQIISKNNVTTKQTNKKNERKNCFHFVFRVRKIASRILYWRLNVSSFCYYSVAQMIKKRKKSKKNLAH